mgnify:FL=1
MMMTSGDFTLTGFSSDTAIANAANGTFTMSSGEVFGYGESDNGKVIISKALADFNGLKVGDEITFFGYDSDGNFLSSQETANLIGDDEGCGLTSALMHRVARVFH